jgi:phosphomannomutase
MAGLTPIKSSADGWRGIIDETFTADFAALVTRCVLRALAPTQPVRTVLVTFDGRRGGERYAAAVANAALEAGAARVRLVPRLPTPLASAALRRGEADVAFLVTASHNPARYNGIKVKVPPGRSLPAAVEREAEQLLGAPGPVAGGPSFAAPDPDPGAGDRWVESHVQDLVERLPGAVGTRRTVVVDGVGGIAGRPMAHLCQRLGWQVRLLGGTPDPDFGGLVPDPTLAATRRRAEEAVRDGGADLAVVLDGDGDRVFVVDERGRSARPHELLALLLGANRPSGGDGRADDVAVTVATGMAVHKVARRQGRGVHETPIGFKFLSPLLADRTAGVAGGSVGDLAFGEHGIDRDPFVAVAMLAELLNTSGGRLGDLVDALADQVGRPEWFEFRVPGVGDAQTLRDAGAQALADVGVAGTRLRITDIDGVKLRFDDDQWMLLRRSTTEAGVRVYGEMSAGTADERLLAQLKTSVGDLLEIARTGRR